MGEQRRRFSEEFKREAVRLAYESGRRLVEVARELELRPDMIRRWRRKLGGGQGPVGTTAEQEVRRLQRELSLVREERDILKKAFVGTVNLSRKHGERPRNVGAQASQGYTM